MMTFLTLKALKHMSLMGHLQSTPQNSLWAWCVIIMPPPPPVTEFNVFVVVSSRHHQHLCVSSDLPVRLHRGVPVLAAVLWRGHHNPERRGPGDHCGGPVDRLQIPSAHRSPRQGKRRKRSHRQRLCHSEINFTNFPFLCFSTEFKERAGFSAGGENSQPRSSGLAKSSVQGLRSHHSHHRPNHYSGEAHRQYQGLWQK